MASLSTHEKLKEIKQNLRLLMNGVTSSSMRNKGVNYKLNWGASVQHLREMAQEYGKDCQLAQLLWQENIRECKILATMIMPLSEINPGLCEAWVQQIPAIEIAELCAMNVFQHAEGASEMAFRWIGSGDMYTKISGYHVLSRLFRRGCKPDSQYADTFLNHACRAILADSVPVRHAAHSSLMIFADLGEEFEKQVEIAAKSNHLELF